MRPSVHCSDDMKFTIYGRLPSLNEYLAAERSTIRGRRGHSAGNSMKHSCEIMIINAIRKARLKRIKSPVVLHYTFYESNRKRDLDNISATAHKFVQDALVKAGILENDGWHWIEGFTDAFAVDAKNPRIEVEIEL